MDCLIERLLVIVLTYLDQVGFVPEGELEGAVALGEAEGAGLVVALQVVLHGLALVTVDQQQDKPCPCHGNINR